MGLMIKEGIGYKEMMIIMDTWPGLFRAEEGDGKTSSVFCSETDGEQTED